MSAPALVERAVHAALATDRRDRVVAWNQAASQLLGHSAKEVLGRAVTDILQPHDLAGNRLAGMRLDFYDMLSRGEPVRGFDLSVSHAAGGLIRVAVSVVVVLEPDDGGYHVVYHLVPVRRRRKADEAIERILSRSNAAGLPFLADGAEKKEDKPPAAAVLTRRQLEVFRLIAEGKTTPQIAESLNLSVNTVRNHIHNILCRLGVHTKVEAVSLALRYRLF